MEAKEPLEKTALHVILKNCQQFASKPALHWLDSNCKVTEQYTYEEVEHRTRELAHGLLHLIHGNEGSSSYDDVLVRERAVLCYPPGLEFILTFLACLRAGIIAVPVSPPSQYQTDYSSEMLDRIIHDCGAAFVLTSKEFANHKSIIELIKRSPVPWHCEVATEVLPEEASEKEVLELLDKAMPHDIPFLQYTSGSTGNPKGVMPSHETLLHNFQLMEKIMKTDSSMVEISFLPHFHAMGLICSYLQTLYQGGTGYFMSPVTFIENPGLWMKAFSLFHGTHAKAPDFAFELVLKKGFPKSIDLSSARYIVSGSEPVCIETIKEFESALAPYGLKKNTVRVGYGLAEHTVYLCGVHDHKDPVIIDGRISSGVPIPGVIIKIVDPETHTVMPEGEEGEIWVDSHCKALGYWEKEEKSQRVFEAHLDEISNRTYLTTGDLGFMKDGNLFVSGRMKNVIIIHGRKIHPSDIEMRIESSFTMLQPGRSVACEYTEEGAKDMLGFKGVAYIAELRSPKSHSNEELNSLAQQISTMIGLNFQVEAHMVVFINPRSMPCTMSGKRQHSICRKKLVNNALSEVHRWSRDSGADARVNRSPSLPNPSKMAQRAPAAAIGTSGGCVESVSTVQVLSPQFHINILEPSDSESNLETEGAGMDVETEGAGLDVNGEHTCTILETSELQVVNDDTVKMLEVNYPDIVRTERRKSAPPLPVDRESQVKASSANYQRRKSAMEKSASLSRLYKRRNSLQTITDTVSGVLGVPLHPDSNIWAHGCNSVKVVQLSQCLQSEFGFAVEPHHLFIHQTPKALLGKLQRSLLNMSSPPTGSNQSDEPLAVVKECSGETGLDTVHEEVHEGEDLGLELVSVNKAAVRHGCDIAIVGMACNFAGCNSIEELWELLVSRKVATTSHFIPTSQDTLSGGFTPAVGVFDYKWFGVSEWEASTMDPQHSMLLHTAWECLENADSVETSPHSQGGRGKALHGSNCGVFVGISMDNDAHYLSYSHDVTPPPTSITSSVAANRIARAFDFKGPVMSIDTACASSLSALDVACKSLRDEDCSVALVCGVNAILDPYRYALLSKMGMLSPDEKCKIFDASANGYVRGEGCGAILLMPLAQAEREGKRILAVVKSTASNNNGALSATLTSPSGKDQEVLIDRALRKARLSAKDVAYVEAHGTGTKLGDPIEVDTIQAVFGSDETIKMKVACKSDKSKKMTDSKKTQESHPILVGSIKANIGHLETGAGIAGLIKTVMVLEHSLAPGNACLERLNPCFRLSSNICITPDNKLLKSVDHPSSLLAAIVNSFGFGGTNATTVLQQYSPLPHMAHTECILIFGTEIKSEMDQSLKDISKAISYLSSRFPEFQKAISTCNGTIQQVTTSLGETCLKAERATVVKFYFALATLFQSLGLKFSIIGGLDILGEILSLVIAKALDLKYAMLLILTSWPPAYNCIQDVQKLIHPPTVPIFSCILEKVCQPSGPQVEIGSSEYCVQMISKLRVRINLPQHLRLPVANGDVTLERLLGIVEKENTNSLPLLSLMAADSSVDLKACEQVAITASKFKPMESSAQQLEQYVRERLIKLRNASDRVRMAKCPSRPMKGIENIMPDFHKRYPLRAHVDPQLKPHLHIQTQVTSLTPEGGKMENENISPNTGTPQTPLTPQTPQTPQTPSPSYTENANGTLGRNPAEQRKLSTLSTSSSTESGYITQDNSRELLPTSVPPNTPISAPSDKTGTRRLEYNLDKEQLAMALKEKHFSNKEQQKWEVISTILEEIKDDLDSPNISLEELAENSMYDLGLDSLNVMHMADFLNKIYNVKVTFSDIVDYGTLGRLAEVIMKQSPEFKNSEVVASSSELLSGSPTLASPKQASPNLSDIYPILTKEGYFTDPPLEDIGKMQPSEDDSSLHLYVKDFTIGRTGVGKMVFEGETDVAYINLDKLVHIEEREADLSPDQPGSGKLNKPATVYFENIYPEEKTMAGHEALIQSLQELCTKGKQPRRFISYRLSSDYGRFIMKVEKFY